MDKELLEKFNKINQKHQSYESSRGYQSGQSFQISQEQFSDDDEPASITSSIYSSEQPATLASLSSLKSASSLSHSSSNASSTSEPIIGKPKSSHNLKSPLINGSSSNGFRATLDSSQSVNGHSLDRNSQISLSSQNGQINSAKSSGSISDEASDRGSGRESADKTRNALSIQLDKRPKSQSELSISSELNLNDSTIPSIDASNLANLASFSNQSDSNLSDPSDSNFSLPSDSNDTANDKEDDKEDEEELVVTNAFANIKLNPFMQKDQKTKLLHRAAKEIRDSEKTYVDVLSLICIQYKHAVRKSISPSVLDSLLQPFDTILQLNTVLLTRFNHCIKNWDRTPKIANVSFDSFQLINYAAAKLPMFTLFFFSTPSQVLVELGPFLKHYADFATKFEQININYSEIKRKYPGNVGGVIAFLIVFFLNAPL